jgi:hypothetical protein
MEAVSIRNKTAAVSEQSSGRTSRSCQDRAAAISNCCNYARISKAFSKQQPSLVVCNPHLLFMKSMFKTKLWSIVLCAHKSYTTKSSSSTLVVHKEITRRQTTSPKNFKIFCFVHAARFCTGSTSTSPCAATTRLRPHALYVDLAMRRDYSSPAARALRRPRRAL